MPFKIKYENGEKEKYEKNNVKTKYRRAMASKNI
jgi:hypothetical protein